MSLPSYLSSLKFDSQGLVPAIIQDHQSSKVLMLGYMNEEAVLKTLEGPHVCFYSRSRNKLWVKGESSGHYQIIKEIRLDCDQDALLILVEQTSAPCHKGYESCFYHKVTDQGLEVVEKQAFDPEEVYKKS